MVILGIDPGLANTGWGIIETRGSSSRARAYDVISSSADESLDVRLGRIYNRVSFAIRNYEPDCVAIEGIYFGANTRSAIWTAHARGAAIAAVAAAGLPLGEYTPMQIKQAVVGTGSADKRQVIYMVRSILKLDHDPRPDHCADALATALCHAHLSASLSTQAQARTQAQNQAQAQTQARPSSQELSRQRVSLLYEGR